MTDSKEEPKSHLMKMKEETEKAGLKLNIQKTKIMASSPITSWQNRWANNGNGDDFIFLGSKITADGDCSQKIKGPLLLGRQAMTNLDNKLKRHLLLGRNAVTNVDGILKRRDITLLTKVCTVKAMVFPVVM